MASRKDHEYDCQQKMGDPMSAVHKLIDSQFARYFHRHRFIYHHWEGIKEIAKLVSHSANKDFDLCYEAAIHHVKLDFYTNYQLPIPVRQQYVGGNGDWPVGEEWNNMCPWNTTECDKHFKVSQNVIDEVKERLK